MEADQTEALKALLERQDGLLVQVSVVLNLSINHVCGEALDCEVELVLPEAISRLGHPVLGPSCVLWSVQRLVVFDSAESLLEHLSVKEWVEGVSRHAECIDLSGNDASVLLTCQVL